MTKEQLEQALAEYQTAFRTQRNELRRLADEAEENDDYEDYDQACYDTWESLMDEGKALADVVAEYLKGSK